MGMMWLALLTIAHAAPRIGPAHQRGSSGAGPRTPSPNVWERHLLLSLFKRRREPPSPELADVERLVTEARRTDQPLRKDELYRAAAHAAVRAIGPGVRKYCRDLLGDDHLGDEAAQQTWVVFWRVLERFEGRSQLSTFIFGIARRVCSDLRRARGRPLPEPDPTEPSHWPDPTHQLDGERRRRAMARAVLTLEPAQRWLLEQRLVEERSYREILPLYQALFGPSINSEEGLRAAIFKAKRRLIEALGGTDD